MLSNISKLRPHKRNFISLVPALLLAACGGGGGSDSGGGGGSTITPATSMQYQGLTTAAVIADDNAEAIFTGFKKFVGPPSLQEVRDNDAQLDDESVFAMAMAFREFHPLLSDLHNNVTPANTAGSTQNCTEGGQLRVESRSQPAEISFEFFNCTQEGNNYDGQMRVSEAQGFGSNLLSNGRINARLAFTELALSDGAETLTFDGIVDCVYDSYPEDLFAAINNFNRQSSTATLHCRTERLLIEDTDERIYQLQDLEFANTLWRGDLRNDPGIGALPGTTSTYSFAGRFFHPDYGYIDVGESSGNLPLAYADIFLDLFAGYALPDLDVELRGDNTSIKLIPDYGDINNADLSEYPNGKLLVNGDTEETAEHVIDIDL